MASYRLLRSNKESGPYSLNDLLTLGLKAYDLIWVDGRSAAWRYPSEIAELKDYSPAIEEQPYDRFYKKSSETETATKAAAPSQYQQPIQVKNPAKENAAAPEPVFAEYHKPVQQEIPKENLERPQINVKQEPVVKQQPVEITTNDEALVQAASEISNPSYQNYQPKPVQQEIPKENLERREIGVKHVPVEGTTTDEALIKPAAEISNPSYQSYLPKPQSPGVSTGGLQQTQQPKKKVFVSMPDNNGFNHHEEHYQPYLPKTNPSQKETPYRAPVTQIPAEKSYYPVEEKSYSPIDIREPEDAKLETKYTQSLDDIKEMYINTLVQRKTRNRKKEIFRKYVKPALVPLFLLISGVAIGFVINYKKSPKVVQSLSTVTPQQTTPAQNEQTPIDEKTDDQILQPEEKTEEKAKVGEKQNLVLNTDNKKKQAKPPTQVSIESQKHNKTGLLIPKAVVPEKKQQDDVIPNNDVASYEKKDVQVDPTTGERTRTMRDNDEANINNSNKESNPKSNSERLKKNTSGETFTEPDRKSSIRDFVSVKTNNYVRGAFGGIRDLELMVYNTSAFLVDEVSIELQIMKPSEQPLRTDIITVKNIGANRAVRIRVPDSQRGMRVDYRITHVESRQWQRSTAGL